MCGVAQQAGVPTEWDVQKLVSDMAAQSARMLPLIEQIRPKEWVTRGASDTYVQQWDSAHAQAQTVKLSADNLVREPERSVKRRHFGGLPLQLCVQWPCGLAVYDLRGRYGWRLQAVLVRRQRELGRVRWMRG